MKIFLTGGTGFVGQPLAKALLTRGWQVLALVRSPEGAEAQALAALGATLARGDVTDRESLRAPMTGADLVFHNAGWYELGLPRAAQAKMRAINVDGTDNVLSLAVELKIPRLVYTSTGNVLGDTGGALVDETFERRAPILTIYEQTKTDAHAIARRYQAQGAPVVIVCPTVVLGVGDHSPFGWFVRMYVRGLLAPMVWAPEGVFTFVHVDDCAEAMALACERGRPGETYILGGGALSMREVVALWKRTPGGLKPFLWLPRPLALLTGILGEPLLRLLGLPAFLSREAVVNSYVCFRFSAARAERELGARFRTAEQAWLDTLAGERAALKQ
jgi:dihydroflavonol-4-reductase